MTDWKDSEASTITALVSAWKAIRPDLWEIYRHFDFPHGETDEGFRRWWIEADEWILRERDPKHRDAVDCLLAHGLIPAPGDLPLYNVKPCICEERGWLTV